MPRDPGLEQLIGDALLPLPHLTGKALTGKAMFGGWAFLLDGKLLCGIRRGSLLFRVGKENEAWATALPGIATAVMGSRRMAGWVRATPEAYASDELRTRLLDAAVAFVRTLPAK